MKSRTTRRFRAQFAALPQAVQQQARAAYRQFLQNPAHPGLRFKKIHAKKPIYSVRVGIHYRAVGIVPGKEIVWYWIGHHSEYDQLLAQM
jgi:hypothetical protein